jgi:hypothetical protein
VRLRRLAEEQARAAELLELDDIYDFSRPNDVDSLAPGARAGWSQGLKPRASKIVLSPYQYEMINYQRMLLRKNIWYYRCVWRGAAGSRGRGRSALAASRGGARWRESVSHPSICLPPPTRPHLATGSTRPPLTPPLPPPTNSTRCRDRMSVPRGPCPLHVLKDAWVQGVVDENTLVWGQVRAAASGVWWQGC